MAHKGPMPSAQPRTLRSETLKKGTNPAGFIDATSTGYYPQGGHPIMPGMPEDPYEGQPAHVSTSGAKPIQNPTPFKIGK